MTTGKELRVLLASDGSDQARAAALTTRQFPWPAGTRVRAVVARETGADHRKSILLAALDRSAEARAESARRELVKRWSEVDAVVVDETPVNGVLAEAKRFAADVIVLGWRGHGPVRRVLMGSVSRGVVRRAGCSVLVAKSRQRVSRNVRIRDSRSAHEQAFRVPRLVAGTPASQRRFRRATSLLLRRPEEHGDLRAV